MEANVFLYVFLLQQDFQVTGSYKPINETSQKNLLILVSALHLLDFKSF